ncbi:MAG TPA: hemin uptake protein HemP [Rhabdaerophilum sp.]|nr:hemin uptake protein HemP [Rhabdaerophilum sp.]
MNRQPDENKRPSGAADTLSGGHSGLDETPRRIEVSDLVGGRREAILIHNGEAYRLRLTANNKLILTK